MSMPAEVDQIQLTPDQAAALYLLAILGPAVPPGTLYANGVQLADVHRLCRAGFAIYRGRRRDGTFTITAAGKRHARQRLIRISRKAHSVDRLAA